MAEHLASLPVVARAVQEKPIPADIPVTVISGAHLTPELLAEHAEIAANSRFGEHIVAEGAAHWVHLDAPEIVVEAVRKMLLRA